jgi:predicted ATPase
VTGPGGVGKTRLAVESGRIQVGIFGGVYFIPLLNLNSYETFLNALANGIGLLFSESKPQEMQLLDYLREKQALLILDNFEQLLEDPRSPNFIAKILENAPEVMVIVTSRERINLQEEYRFVLDGLSYPHNDFERKQPSEVYEAVVLFEKRARKINQNFRLNSENQTPILKICSLMQGHPLGIELIASFTPHQAWDDLLGEIENDLHRLESQYANAPAQHKTLAAVFDASWHRLTPQQQRVLCSLSVCRGGFTDRAAVFIAESSGALLADGQVAAERELKRAV